MDEFLRKLLEAGALIEAEAAVASFETNGPAGLEWLPVGRENNRGTIELASDPGRSLVERLTNGIDAILELEHQLHGGRPECASPREAAEAWLNVPPGGLSEMSAAARRSLAQRVSIKVAAGEGKESRTVEVRDFGIGLSAEEMPRTILSLNESNKARKLYLAGAYGQGGSSTFAVSKLTLVAARSQAGGPVGFTVVRFLELPLEEFKPGRYVFLASGRGVLKADLPAGEFLPGTLVKHFGYDLTNYRSPLGPRSVYGLLNQVLFDPVLPVWLENAAVANPYRRVIKGVRSALNGAVDEGDERRRGPLPHNVRMFYVPIGDFGRVGIEYWLLEQPSTENKKPIEAFVNPVKPIVLTLLGQNQGELSHLLVKKEAELPYLALRLIVHVECNGLTPRAKRALFVSNREDARRGQVLDLIREEVIKALRSDDELARLNAEAKAVSYRERDEAAEQRMRSEVSRLLRLQGLNVGSLGGAEVNGDDGGSERPTHPRVPRPLPAPIEIHEPPTFIRILWPPGEAITFYPEQRRYLRIETDANSTYHDSSAPTTSRVNLILEGGAVTSHGSTSLQGGRMRGIFEAKSDAGVGTGGTIRVELSRLGLPTLSDQRPFEVVEAPTARPAARRVMTPNWKIDPVEGPDDPLWANLGWGDPATVASEANMESGVLQIYYSKVFPRFKDQLNAFERREPALAQSFTKRYEIWVAVHSLILYQDQQVREGATHSDSEDQAEEAEELHEQRERCRLAQLAAMFAAREVEVPAVLALDAE